MPLSFALLMDFGSPSFIFSQSHEQLAQYKNYSALHWRKKLHYFWPRCLPTLPMYLQYDITNCVLLLLGKCSSRNVIIDTVFSRKEKRGKLFLRTGSRKRRRPIFQGLAPICIQIQRAQNFISVIFQFLTLIYEVLFLTLASFWYQSQIRPIFSQFLCVGDSLIHPVSIFSGAFVLTFKVSGTVVALHCISTYAKCQRVV